MKSENQAQPIQLDGPYLDILSLRHEGLCCSQIIMKLTLRDLGRENPDLVRSMAALCFGGYGPGTCGVLTGAACALSLSLENSSGCECPAALLPLLLRELSDWFSVTAAATYGGIRCEEILTASPDKRACTVLLLAALEKLQSMLTTVGTTANGCEHGRP